MSISIKTKRDITPVLRRLSKIHKSENGQISWSAGDLEELTFALHASLTFSTTIADHEKDGALWRTVNDCAREGKFTSEFFLHRLRANIGMLHAGAMKPYTVACQLNVPTHNKLPKTLTSMNGAISVSRRMPQWHQKAVAGIEDHHRERLQSESGFVYLRHTLKARSSRLAVDEGYRAFQFTIGLLNLASRGYGLGTRHGMPDVPLGKLLLASSTQLLDQKQRKLGDWIVESRFPHAYRRSFTATFADLAELAPFTTRWVRRIKATEFSDRLSTAVIQFQEAISSTQIDTTLIKLWTCIELLCARSDQKDPLERVIDRASSIFIDPEASKVRLAFIADSRHALVHRGDESHHALVCAQWASVYAAELIGFCVFNKFKLRRHAEILDYLSTPRSPERVEEIIRIHQLRLKALRGKKTETT